MTKVNTLGSSQVYIEQLEQEINRLKAALKEKEYEIYEWKIPYMDHAEQESTKPEGYDEWEKN